MDSNINPYTFPSLEGKEEVLAQYTYYDTKWDQGPIESRKIMYEKMPNIETLKIYSDGFLNQDFYLRPKIKKIYLEFKLTFEEDRKYVMLDFLYKSAFLDWFKTLKKFLQEHPESQMEELHIQFSPEVRLHLCIRNYHIIEYDEDGPIYEDEEWSEKTSKQNPSDYLFCLTKEGYNDLKKIGKSLLKLLAMKQWKAITLPYEFPSAAKVVELYPFTTFTDKVEKEGVEERVSASLQEFHRVHRRATKKLNIY